MVSHERDTYSIMSLSDWTMCHGQTDVYMAWTWHVALSNIKASCKLTTISHPVIDSSDIVLSLLLSLQRVHCSHVWVWVMHVGSVDVRVMILQYRRWSVQTTCPSYTHANSLISIFYVAGLSLTSGSLQWCYNGCNGISNHQPQDGLLNRLFRHRSKKTSKLRITGLYAGNSPVAIEFPAQVVNNSENVSIWWCHYV